MPLHRSKRARALAFFALAAACGKDPTIVTRTVTMHVPSACATGPSAFGLFIASGDFDPAVQEGHLLRDVGLPLASVPESTRSLLVDVASDALAWWGVRDVGQAGDVDVLLWPATTPCALTGDVGKRDGTGLAAMSGGKVLVAGGIGDPVPATFVVDLGTGAVAPLPNGLLTARSRATVTAFGDGGLVAGGASADGALLGQAEVYVASTGDFDRSAIVITPRADHGAVVLATGETLLVGGVGASGSVLGSMEIVDPVTRSARTQALRSLAVPRKNPHVLRLASGDILVAGGFDAQGAPVAVLEWFTPDARAARRLPAPLVARPEQAFVALPAGGALAVIARDPSGLPAENVWVIAADGSLDNAQPLTVPLVAPRLIVGAQGKPILWTGTQWLQWQAWAGAFTPLSVNGSAAGPTDDAIASPDPGLALWLTRGGATTAVTGMRFDTRGAFASTPASLLATDTTLTAPDRLVTSATTSIAFGAQGLSLQADASVFVTDATYASVALDFDAPTGQPARVVLRDERGVEVEIGGVSCPLAPGQTSIHLERRGAAVAVQGATCAVRGDARVSIGFRGSPPQSVIRNVRILRL